jgi:sugar lactone lactonase YvrE
MVNTVLTLCVASVLVACVTDHAEQPELGDHDGFDDTGDDGKADAASVRTIHWFADRKLYPEGGAFDPVERAFYVGSLGRGNITRVDAAGTESIFFAGTGEADRYTLGMQVDAVTRRLWVCTTKDSLGTIWVFDLETRLRTAAIALTAVNPRGSCNDVLVDTDGSVLVSDRENHHIYRVDAAGRIRVWANDPLLKGALVSLNSMDFTPDRSALITATYLQPRLVRISLRDPGDVRAVRLEGDAFMDGFNVLNGPDDLVFHGNDLIVAFGSSIKRIRATDASWTRATVRSTRTIGGVTGLVKAGGKLYGLNGQSVRFLLRIPPSSFQIFEIDTAALR